MLNVGDKVLVSIPPNELTVSGNIRQFNGRTHKITDRLRLPGAQATQYTLEGCVGNQNKRYWFLEEWLIPLEESEVEA